MATSSAQVLAGHNVASTSMGGYQQELPRVGDDRLGVCIITGALIHPTADALTTVSAPHLERMRHWWHWD
jgi:hypothetical protein